MPGKPGQFLFYPVSFWLLQLSWYSHSASIPRPALFLLIQRLPPAPPAVQRAIDGTTDPVEPINAALQNYPLILPGSGDPFTTTLNIMNTGYTLYMDIKIDDDEYYNYGNYIPGL